MSGRIAPAHRRARINRASAGSHLAELLQLAKQRRSLRWLRP